MQKKLLVVDDDDLTREMIALVLETAGFSVSSADSGFAALGVLGNEDGFFAVLSDMVMPDITGLELMEQVHLSFPDLPFIILTGETGSDFAAKAVSQGARACVVKSEDFDMELLRALESICD